MAGNIATLYGVAVASATLASANTLTLASGSGTATAKNTTVGNSLGYVELLSQGGTGTTFASLQAPSGHGWFLDDATVLAGAQTLAGQWFQTLRLATSANTCTATLSLRVYQYDTSALTYTLLGTLSLAGAALTSTNTNYTLQGAVSSVAWASNHRLYLDVWADITATTLASGNTIKIISQSNAANLGLSGWAVYTANQSQAAFWQEASTDTGAFTGALSAGNTQADKRLNSLALIRSESVQPAGWWPLGKNTHNDLRGLVWFNSQNANRSTDPANTSFGGILIIRHWAELNPAQGVYNWTGGSFPQAVLSTGSGLPTTSVTLSSTTNPGDGIGLDGDLDLWSAKGLLASLPPGAFAHDLFVRTPAHTPWQSNTTPWGWTPPYGASMPYWVLQGLQAIQAGNFGLENDGKSIIMALWHSYVQQQLATFVAALASHLENGPYQQYIKGVSIQMGGGSETSPDTSGTTKAEQGAFLRSFATPCSVDAWMSTRQQEIAAYQQAFSRTPLIVQADETFEDQVGNTLVNSGGLANRAGVQAMAVGARCWLQNDSGESTLTSNVSFGAWDRTGFIAEQGQTAASTGLPWRATLTNLVNFGARYVYGFASDQHSDTTGAAAAIAALVQPDQRLDWSGGGRTLTTSGKVCLAAAIAGDTSLGSSFDGLTGYLTATSTPIASARAGWTLEAVAEPWLAPQTAILAMLGDDSGGVALGLHNGNLAAWISGIGWLDSGQPLPGRRQLVHLAMQSAPANVAGFCVLTFFVNGSAVGQWSYVAPASISARTTIGAGWFSGAAVNCYAGSLWQVQAYGSGYSAARIAAHALLLLGPAAALLPLPAQASVVSASVPANSAALPMSLPRILLPAGPVAPPGSALITIAGTDVQIQHGSISIQNIVGQRSTGSFVVEDLTNTQRFKQGQAVYIYDDAGNVAFSGVVTDDQRARSPKAGDTLHTVSVADWHYLADKRLAAYSATNKTAGAIVNDLLSQFLAAEGVVAGTIAAGATVVSFVCAYAPVSAALDALVAKMGNGWFWQIDQLKRLQFQQQTSAPLAPFVANEDTMEWGTVTPTHGNPNYANSVYVIGGVAETSTQTETRQGDGKATAFTMSYELASAPTITLNSVSQTVKLKSAGSGTAQWYWAPGDPVIAQDSGGTKLVSTDVLSVTYIGQFPNVALSTNGSAVSAQQGREGVGSGVVETAVVDTTTTSTGQAFQTAAGWLSKYAQDLDTIEFLTKEAGLAQGQLLTVDDPADDFTNAQMLIEECDLTDVGPIGSEIGTLWYKVKAVSGPINQGWQAFFKQLASQQNNVIDSVQVGQAQTVAILASFTAAFTWAATLNATVLTCPVFPMTFPKTFC